MHQNYVTIFFNKFYFKCVIIVMLFAQQEEELINVRRGLQALFLSEDREF